MTRQPLVVANWKMHGSRQMVVDLVGGVLQGAKDYLASVVICPPNVYLTQVVEQVKASALAVGAQNVNANIQGAFTGEVSPAMLQDIGCRYVIIGHSERRTLYKETDEEVAAKCAAAIAAGLIPIACVGETLMEREQGSTEAVVDRQLQSVLAAVRDIEKLVIAYEPVWAIGTGKTATADQAQQVHAFIRQQLAVVDESKALQVRLLYGGSVKAANAQQLFAMPDIDGGLIGGASLVVDEFVAICKAAT